MSCMTNNFTVNLVNAERGDGTAQYNLGTMYLDGQEVTKDLSKAMEWLTKAAEQGHDMALIRLRSLHFGGGASMNLCKSIDWWTKCAEQGYAEAQCFLGIIYLEDRGEANNLSKAIEWLTKSAEQGHLWAQYSLGETYSEYKKYSLAIEWYAKAADQGFGEAQFRLGVMYAKGMGVAKNEAKAIMLWTKAAEGGHVDSRRKLVDGLKRSKRG